MDVLIVFDKTCLSSHSIFGWFYRLMSILLRYPYLVLLFYPDHVLVTFLFIRIIHIVLGNLKCVVRQATIRFVQFPQSLLYCVSPAIIVEQNGFFYCLNIVS